MGIEPTQDSLHYPAPDLKSGSPTSELGASTGNVLDQALLGKPFLGVVQECSINWCREEREERGESSVIQFRAGSNQPPDVWRHSFLMQGGISKGYQFVGAFAETDLFRVLELVLPVDLGIDRFDFIDVSSGGARKA